MTPETVMMLGQQSLIVMVKLASPLLLAALATGFVIGMLQAATQINEMTLSFVPKLAAMAVLLVITGPWLLQTLVDYTQRLVTSIPGMIG